MAGRPELKRHAPFEHRERIRARRRHRQRQDVAFGLRLAHRRGQRQPRALRSLQPDPAPSQMALGEPHFLPLPAAGEDQNRFSLDPQDPAVLGTQLRAAPCARPDRVPRGHSLSGPQGRPSGLFLPRVDGPRGERHPRRLVVERSGSGFPSPNVRPVGGGGHEAGGDEAERKEDHDRITESHGEPAGRGGDRWLLFLLSARAPQVFSARRNARRPGRSLSGPPRTAFSVRGRRYPGTSSRRFIRRAASSR